MSRQYSELRPTIAAEIGLRVWGTPANCNGFRVLASLLQRRRSSEANQTAGCLAVSWTATLCIHLGDSCLLTEFRQVQNSLCVQVLRSPPILAALLNSTGAAADCQSLRHGTRNGFTQHSQTAAPIFGRAAITLGTCPHSSSVLFKRNHL